MKDKKRIVLGTQSLPKNIQEEQDYISRGSIYVSHATTMYRRDLALEIGGYREFFRFGSEDHDFFAQLDAKTQITNLQERLLWYRVNAPTSVFRLTQAQPLLDRLPQVLSLPPYVTLQDLQSSPYWSLELTLKLLKRKSLKARTQAELYSILAHAYRKKSNFPDGKNYMYKTILCILKAIWNSIRRLWT